MQDYQTKYMRFQKHSDTSKTQVWHILSKHGVSLGEIRWYGPWRQYTVFPEDGTLFNSGCLTDIKTLLDALNVEHKNGLHRRD